MTTVNTLTKNIIAISDVEGFDINSTLPVECHCNSVNECLICNTNDIFICGDLLDSTSAPGHNINENKKFNLRNILKVIKHTNINLILGNRDLNKIKCLSLNKLNTDGINSKNFNDGNIILNYSTYESLLAELKENGNPWFAPMKHWYTFWSPTLGDKGKKIWKAIQDYSKTPFLNRFNEIFGADNSIGTMSADNLLHTIPLELVITDGKIQSMNNKSEKSIEKINDYKAFIVLAIFNSMLINQEPTLKFPTLNIETLNSSSFKGWLYKLLTESKVCDYKIDEGKIYIFSHGGITFELIKKYKEVESFKEKLTGDLKNVLTDADKIIYKTGGYYNNKNEKTKYITLEELKNNIIQINEIYKTTINNIFVNGTQSEPDQNMLFLLAMTAPLNCDNLSKKLIDTKLIDTKLTCFNTEMYSPVQPGFGMMRNPDNNFFIEKFNIYQIFGHKPIGFGTTVDLIENNNDKVLLVILDTSNTFRGTPDNADSKTSYNYLEIIKNKNPIIYSNIDLKINDKQNPKNIMVQPFNGITFEKLTTEHTKNKFYTSDTSKIINIKQEINNNFIDILKKTKTNSNNFNINMHGILYTEDNKPINFIFSINTIHNTFPAMFEKSLFNLKTDEFKIFMNLPKTDKNNNFMNLPKTVGRYFDKYIKYKNKYLQLKNNY